MEKGKRVIKWIRNLFTVPKPIPTKYWNSGMKDAKGKPIPPPTRTRVFK